MIRVREYYTVEASHDNGPDYILFGGKDRKEAEKAFEKAINESRGGETIVLMKTSETVVRECEIERSCDDCKWQGTPCYEAPEGKKCGDCTQWAEREEE